jgi:hypothetical protein
VPEVHVVPDKRTGTWLVRDTDVTTPSFQYDTQTAAERAARLRARERGATRVVVHDRYHRTREIAPLPVVQ